MAQSGLGVLKSIVESNRAAQAQAASASSSPATAATPGAAASSIGGAASSPTQPTAVAPPTPSVIDVRNLSLTFLTNDGPVEALSGIDLAVARGEFVALIGPSGCGKTTLLRVIADLEKPTGGSISVNGVSAEEARQKRAYGYVFQAAALYPWRTIFHLLSRSPTFLSKALFCPVEGTHTT